MCKVICNIPHSSTVIPKWAINDILISQEELFYLVDFMTDKDTDKIWEFVSQENKVVATTSRLIVDTERFRNDVDEAMSQKGMGLYYTHTPFGKQFRLKTEESYKKCLLLYDAYHTELENKVSECIKKYGECIIVDCHSFHDQMDYTNYNPNTFPDVCIGLNGEITDKIQFIIDAFKSNGYSVSVNEPFSGSLIPLKYLYDNRVISLMIELNRRIYDNSSFEKVQNICKEIYNQLKV